MTGRLPDGSIATVEIAPPGTPAANYGFDVTPARLVTGFITERGVAPATPNALVTLYPEHRKGQAAYTHGRVCIARCRSIGRSDSIAAIAGSNASTSTGRARAACWLATPARADISCWSCSAAGRRSKTKTI